MGEQEIQGRIETVKTTALLRSAKILRKSWRPGETYYHSDVSKNVSKNSSVITCVKNSLRAKQQPGLVLVNEKEKNGHIVDFAILEDHRIKVMKRKRKKKR